jgi:hypothetical protein
MTFWSPLCVTTLRHFNKLSRVRPWLINAVQLTSVIPNCSYCRQTDRQTVCHLVMYSCVHLILEILVEVPLTAEVKDFMCVGRWSCKGKGKVVHVLFFNWAQRHQGVLREWRYRSTYSSTSALDGDERSASRPSRFTHREGAPGIHWIGGWVGPRAVSDAVVKRKIPSPRRESNSRTPIVQPVAQRYTDGAITALKLIMHSE